MILICKYCGILFGFVEDGKEKNLWLAFPIGNSLTTHAILHHTENTNVYREFK